MAMDGKGKILRIFLNENSRYEDRPLYEALVQKAFQHGLAGSMVFRGIQGFGFCCKSCRTHGLGMTISKCQPMTVEFIDREEKLREIIPVFKEMLPTGAMIMQDAEIIFNRGE